MWIYYTFELVYLFNAVATCILIYSAHSKRHTEGFSFYSRLMFTVASVIQIYYFVHSPMSDFTLFWAISIGNMLLHIYQLYSMRKFTGISIGAESNDIDYRLLFLAALILTFISLLEKSDSHYLYLVAIRFCNFTEALGLVPQIKLMWKNRFVPHHVGYYLLSLMIARIFRVLFWFELNYWNKYYNDTTETFYVLILADVIYVLLIADFVYLWFKYRNSTLIPLS